MRKGQCVGNHSMNACVRGGLVFLMAGAMASSAWGLNNCLDGDFLDRRGSAEIQIANDGSNPLLYRPRCVLISEGTLINFRALPNFGMHPLFGGIVSGGVATMDPDSPIGSMTSGEEEQRTLVDSGEFPYFCDVHYGGGMLGSIRVVPELFANGFE
jgi:plastocyanin